MQEYSIGNRKLEKTSNHCLQLIESCYQNRYKCAFVQFPLLNESLCISFPEINFGLYDFWKVILIEIVHKPKRTVVNRQT